MQLSVLSLAGMVEIAFGFKKVKFLADSLIIVNRARVVFPLMEAMAEIDAMRVLPTACQDECLSYHVPAAQPL